MSRRKSTPSPPAPAGAGGKFLAEMDAFVRARRLLEDGEVVVVGISGGPDSVALAAGLIRRGRNPVRLAHVHHGLRPDADADEHFVAELAQKWSVPFASERIDTPALARRWGIGLEVAARRGRYRALAELARRWEAHVVAVAHHADDQVETVLHRLVRGTHIRGLAGMPAQRRLEGPIRLVRPLLWADRRRIEAFCRAGGLSWRTDPTNAQSQYTRNFIRRELLPLLRARLNPRVNEALLRLSSAAEEVEAALGQLSEDLFRRACRSATDEQVVLRTAPLRKAPPLVASLAVRAALARLGAPEQELTRGRFQDLRSVLDGDAAAVDLPGGFRAERARGAVRLFRARTREI